MIEDTQASVLAHLQALANPERAKVVAGYFKTGPGQYGEGDQFWGLSVPQVRAAAKRFRDLPLAEIVPLLAHPVHEVRLTGAQLLVDRYPKDPEGTVNAYLANRAGINNWDLVDGTAAYILGPYLQGRPKDLLTEFAASQNVWERRIAMLTTYHFIKNGDCAEALRIATLLLHDRHDLIQKAAGWMLRESGKRCGEATLTGFLDTHAQEMPRTMLRYAVERLRPEQRERYMGMKARG